MSERQQYDRTFKLSAVRLLEESELSVAQVARRLGIHESMLRRWRRQVAEQGVEAFNATGRHTGTEVERLRRENHRLKRELEMVKKTVALLEQIDKRGIK